MRNGHSLDGVSPGSDLNEGVNVSTFVLDLRLKQLNSFTSDSRHRHPSRIVQSYPPDGAYMYFCPYVVPWADAICPPERRLVGAVFLHGSRL